MPTEKYVWMANKSGGQKIGNQTVIQPLTRSIYRDCIDKNGKSYREFMGEQDKHIMLLRKMEPMTGMAAGWYVTDVGPYKTLHKFMTTGVAERYALAVDSFDSSRAVEWQHTDDEKVYETHGRKLVAKDKKFLRRFGKDQDKVTEFPSTGYHKGKSDIVAGGTKAQISRLREAGFEGRSAMVWPRPSSARPRHDAVLWAIGLGIAGVVGMSVYRSTRPR